MKIRRNILYVIGIDLYASAYFPKLDNAVRDAQGITELLTKRYEFEIFPDSLFNSEATKENIYQGFNSLMQEVGPDDNLVIYYSGHGRMHTVGGQGYWVPHEAKNSIGDFIENSVIKDYIERIKAKHIFLIADSCFSGTFLTRTRGQGSDREYSTMDSRVSRWMFASGSEETVSDGIKGNHSPFARYLIKCLSVNDNKYMSVHELIRYVSIMTEHNSSQHPNGAPIENIGHDRGQMVFILKEEFVKTTKEKSNGLPVCRKLMEEVKSYESQEKRLSTGKEILLIESFIKEGEIMVVELFRFEDDGKKKHHFSDGALKMVTKKGEATEWKVIRRFATWQGFTRFWDESGASYEGKKPIVLRADESIEEVEDTDAAIDYNDTLKDLLESNREPLRCLHCGEMISSNDSSMVEIDEAGLKLSAGNVHNACLRPLDRIIGKSILPEGGLKNVVSFDSRKWLELLRHGQFHWGNALRASNGNPIWTLTWNRQHISNTGDYCIRQILDNGKAKYIRLGKQIQRFPETRIDEELAFMKKAWKDSITAGDPFAYTDKQYLFAVVSELEKRKQPDEKILHILDLEKVKYSRQIESETENIDNDYAPVGLVVIPGTMQIVNFGNCIPIIFDPAKFDILHKNWNESGYTIGPCGIKIIESDREFDLFLMTVLEEGMQPIVHPMFDKEKELISGTYLQDIRYFTEQNEEEGEGHSYPLKKNPD